MSIRRIFLRRDTAANFASTNPVLSEGEPGFQTDPGNQILKVGDGTTPWNSLAQLYDIAGINANATAINAHSTRITNLETFSPLGSGTGTVTGITWRNLTELALAGEKITNGTLNAATVTTLSNDTIAGLKLWLDASDLTSAGSTWLDKSGNANHATKNGSPAIATNAQNGLSVMRYSGVDSDYHEWTDLTDIRTIFWVIKANPNNSGFLLGDDDQYHFHNSGGTPSSITFWAPYASPDILNGDLAINGTRGINGQTTPFNYLLAPISIVSLKTTGNIEASRFSKDRNIPGRNWNGDLGELLIFNDGLSNSDIEKIEGYLAHKWSISLPSGHTYQSTAPLFPGTQGWAVQSGVWDETEQVNGVLTGAVAIRQNVNLGSGGVYDVTVDRTDTNNTLTSKIRTSHPVTWLSHANAIASEADVAHDGTARFEVTSTVPTYIELDTIATNRTITSVSMTQSVLAGGTVQAGSNGTLEKIAGADAWNAGASSTEYIGGQNEGYVQFQIGQTGKDLKTGLVYADVDYGDADPFEMTFSTDVSIGGSVRTTYASADFFRIRHDSSNNQIQYQKRQTTSNGLEYVTFHTDTTTTNGSNLYFDTSFYHLNGRINDVTMVV